MKKLKRPAVVAFLIAFSLTAVLYCLELVFHLAIPGVLLLCCRWLTIATLAFYTVTRGSLTAYILFSMVAGAEVGYDFPAFAVNLNILSKVFLSLIKTVIAPLLFGTLVVGIAGHPDLKQVGRMGWKSILYFEIVSTIALFIGLAAINISGAGIGVQLPADGSVAPVTAAQKQTWQDIVLNIFPENIAKSIFQGNVLQIVVFSILFGVAVALVKEKYRHPMIRFAESLSEVMFKFTRIIMFFAPVAVFAAIAYSVGHMGLPILVNLFKMLATLYVALVVFIGFVLVPVMLLFRIPVKKFFKAVSEPATLAFATTSSESALPIAMEKMEQFGVPRKIVSFVLPTGYSFNLDGTTLYLSLASIFVAQVAGIHLPLEQQLLMMFTLMLTSKGVAGVPRASLVILMAMVTDFGLPVLPVFIILGIDELMDMARTAVNVIGNCLASAVVARWEGELVIAKEP